MGKKRTRPPVHQEEVQKEEDDFEKELAAAREMLLEKEAAAQELEEQEDGDEVGGDEDDDEGRERLPPRANVYNKRGLEQALAEVQARNGPRPWPETLEICQFELGLDDVHDDIKRETAFYQNALQGVKQARLLLAQYNVPYQRPADYFCDMLKSDDHMARVKDRLLFEQKKIAAVEERRRQQENRKFSKELKNHRTKEKTDDKKRTMDAVKQWKKDKASRTGQGLLPDDDGLEDVLEGKGAQQRGGGGRNKPNKKRLAKDKKYGFGGPKKKFKQSDAKSLNDFSSFNPKKGKVSSYAKKGGNQKNKGANRPGKTARTRQRVQRKSGGSKG